MNTIPLADLIIPERFRKAYNGISELAEMIKTVGLIQPIILTPTPEGKFKLTAGGRRTEALKLLGETTLYHSSTSCPGKPGYLFTSEVSEDVRLEIELTENHGREDFSWQEECVAIDKLHSLKKRSAALNSKTWGQEQTGRLLNVSQSFVSYSIIIAKHILDGDKEIIGAENPSDAWNILMRRDVEIAQAELAQRHLTAVANIQEEDFNFTEPEIKVSEAPVSETERQLDEQLRTERDKENVLEYIAFVNSDEKYLKRVESHWLFTNPDKTPADFLSAWKSRKDNDVFWEHRSVYAPVLVDLSSHYIHADCIPFMLSKPEAFDHIITDIPYGIDIENIDQSDSITDISTIKAEHTVEGNKELFKQFFPAAYHCLKPNSFLITWCDQMLWQEMFDLAVAAGFKVQRWPFYWIKDYPCLNQMAQTNFTKSTEIAMVCRKGVITLPEKQSNNYILCGKDELCASLGHPFAKPFALWERLFKAVSIENQYILDPFCGRGSAFISGTKLGRHMVGIEKDDAHYNAGLENLKQFYLKINPKTMFK